MAGLARMHCYITAYIGQFSYKKSLSMDQKYFLHKTPKINLSLLKSIKKTHLVHARR